MYKGVELWFRCVRDNETSVVVQALGPSHLLCLAGVRVIQSAQYVRGRGHGHVGDVRSLGIVIPASFVSVYVSVEW